MIVKLKDEGEISIRGVEDSDAAFIYSAWCHQVRKYPPFHKFSQEEFSNHKLNVIDRLVGAAMGHDGLAETLVAAHAGDGEPIYGFICYHVDEAQWQPYGCIHFIYVKGNMRGFGIARALLEAAIPNYKDIPLYATHRAQAFNGLQAKLGFKWDPYRVL